MARVKRGIQTHKRHKKILSLTKGYKLGRSKLFRQAKQAMLKAGQFAYRDRRNKKRDFRRLWIVQLNAAVRPYELSYSQFINGLALAEITLDRKVLSQLSIQEPAAFAAVVEQAKVALAKAAAK
jgi:large subunit ribosomal protein L20